MLIQIKNHVSAVMILSKMKYPKNATGILFTEPTIAYVVGPVAATQERDAKFNINPINPANMFFDK